jgi:hypothetical protein
VQAHAITEREMREHVDFLASDLLEGRDSGQRGAEIAALYIAEEFERCGLQPLGEQWQIPFDLPGAAGRGRASITVGDRELTGESLLSVPSMAAVGQVKARACTIEGDVKDAVVVVPAVERSGARTVAKDLLARGALAVILLSEDQFLTPEADFDMRRLDGGGGGKGGVSMSLESLPEELRKQIEAQLGGVSGQIRVQIAGGENALPPTSGARKGDAPSRGAESWQLGAPSEVFASRRLGGPVVWAAQVLAEELTAAAEAGETVSLDVSRSGSDRSANVIGVCRGSDPRLANEYVVIGAHYDHVGADGHGRIWNGADDNASGTAAVLAAARAIGEMPVKPKRSIVFAAWSAEERGLVGSRAFAGASPIPFDRIAAYVNLDMISRNDARSIQVMSASDDLKQLAQERVAAQDMQAVDGMSRYLAQSDTAPFVERNVPSVFFFCGEHEDYHRATDDPQKIDAAKAARVAQAALEVVLAAATASERPHFKEAEMGPLFSAAPAQKRLGIIPVMGTKDDGVVVDRVNSGGVADKAGLQPGDRIIRVGTSKITTVPEMRRVLEEQADGKPFPIEVVRKTSTGEEGLVLEGVFPARKT